MVACRIQVSRWGGQKGGLSACFSSGRGKIRFQQKIEWRIARVWQGGEEEKKSHARIGRCIREWTPEANGVKVPGLSFGWRWGIKVATGVANDIVLKLH